MRSSRRCGSIEWPPRRQTAYARSVANCVGPGGQIGGAMRPETRYAKSGDVHIAYQVVGDGPIDLVYVPGGPSHVEYQWGLSATARAFQRMASFSRLILFDKRGTGL